MSAAEFLIAFPQTERDVSTGGGFSAWQVPRPTGGYVLVTGDPDDTQPTGATETVSLGVYDKHGNWDEVIRGGMSWHRAIEFVRHALEFGK